MKKYPLEKIDAFTTGFSTGNPAALVALDCPDDITPEQMQRIAFELRGCVSEVGYVWPLPEPEVDFELRYYSSEQEVPFCGHATVAILHRLISTTPALSTKDELHIRTRCCLLKVRNKVREENLVYIHAPEPIFTDADIPHTAIATALDLPLPRSFRTARHTAGCFRLSTVTWKTRPPDQGTQLLATSCCGTAVGMVNPWSSNRARTETCQT